MSHLHRQTLFQLYQREIVAFKGRFPLLHLALEGGVGWNISHRFASKIKRQDASCKFTKERFVSFITCSANTAWIKTGNILTDTGAGKIYYDASDE